jgi:hypothetical protein
VATLLLDGLNCLNPWPLAPEHYFVICRNYRKHVKITIFWVISPKRWWISTGLHGVTFRKMSLHGHHRKNLRSDIQCVHEVVLLDSAGLICRELWPYLRFTIDVNVGLFIPWEKHRYKVGLLKVTFLSKKEKLKWIRESYVLWSFVKLFVN